MYAQRNEAACPLYFTVRLLGGNTGPVDDAVALLTGTVDPFTNG